MAAVLVDPVRPSAPRNLRFELLDSVRAIAALSVVLYHAAGWAGVNLLSWYGSFTSKLEIGVTLFFLLSGFLLYRPHAVALLGGPPAPPTRDYALRRAFRILPAYWVALTLLALWPGLRGPFTKNWWAYYGLLQSYRAAWAERGIGVEWSLSVEASFYVFLPVLAWALARASRRLGDRGRVRLQLLVLASLGAASLAFRALIHHEGIRNLTNSLPANLLGFTVGMALAVASARLEGRERDSRAARWITGHAGWCWAAAALLFSAASLSPAFPRPFAERGQSTLAFTAESLLYSAIALFVVLPAVFGERAEDLPRRLLRSRALSWVGKISYGIFLWHLPLLGVLKRSFFPWTHPTTGFACLALLIVPIALSLGWLSWRLVELPALRAARALGARGILGAMARAPELRVPDPR